MYWLPYSSHTSHHPSQTPCLPWVSYATQKLILDSCRMLQKQSEAFHTFLWHHFFPSLKQNFIAYRSSKVSDCIFEINQLWQSGFSMVYSNSCCSCWFELEIMKISQTSHKMYSNNILNFQKSTTILNAHTKKIWKLIVCTSYNYMISIKYFYIIMINICLSTNILFQVFLSNTNNFQTDLLDLTLLPECMNF